MQRIPIRLGSRACAYLYTHARIVEGLCAWHLKFKFVRKNSVLHKRVRGGRRNVVHSNTMFSVMLIRCTHGSVYIPTLPHTPRWYGAHDHIIIMDCKIFMKKTERAKGFISVCKSNAHAIGNYIVRARRGSRYLLFSPVPQPPLCISPITQPLPCRYDMNIFIICKSH